MRSLSRLLIVLTFLGVAAFTAVPATAADKSGADPAIAAALQRIADRNHTPADVALIKSHPDIAAQVSDPDRPPTVEVTVRDNLGRVVDPAANSAQFLSCYEYWVEITSYTYLGFVHWQWKHVANTCYDGVVVTQWQSRYATMTYSDGTAYAGSMLGDAASVLPATPAMSFMQQRIDICVFVYGCYASYAPWSRININGDGSFWYNWGAPGG